VPEQSRVTKHGDGVAIMVQDSSMIGDHALNDELCAIAEKAGSDGSKRSRRARASSISPASNCSLARRSIQRSCCWGGTRKPSHATGAA